MCIHVFPLIKSYMWKSGSNHQCIFTLHIKVMCQPPCSITSWIIHNWAVYPVCPIVQQCEKGRMQWSRLYITVNPQIIPLDSITFMVHNHPGSNWDLGSIRGYTLCLLKKEKKSDMHNIGQLRSHDQCGVCIQGLPTSANWCLLFFITECIMSVTPQWLRSLVKG